jgi:hypothetical protein
MATTGIRLAAGVALYVCCPVLHRGGGAGDGTTLAPIVKGAARHRASW